MVIKKLMWCCAALLVVSCGNQVEGEYTSSKSAFFTKIDLSLMVDKDQAELSVIRGSKPAEVEQLNAVEEDGRLILYKEGEEDKQLIFTVLDDGNKLRYEPSSGVGLPEIWVRKAKI